MVSIVTKKIRQKEYLYLVTSIREGKRVIQKTIKYIGKKRPISKHEFACMKQSHHREDWILQTTQNYLPYTTHKQLQQASAQHREEQQQMDNMSREKQRERFLSKFIADSNSIEGSTMTREETAQYLFEDSSPQGSTKKELFMAKNLLNAWEYLEKKCKTFPTEQDIKKLHKLVNKDIEEENTQGKYKHIQNYIGEVYTTSHLFVKERMKELLAWIQQAYKEVDDFEVAFQSHAQFELIHPFIDGNGRVGRLLINWLLLLKGLSPIAIRSKRRNQYISALANAQRGKLEAIGVFLAEEYLEEYNYI
jgi:Fic family protein